MITITVRRIAAAIVAILICAPFSMLLSKDEPLVSSWAAVPPKVDGSAADWEGIPLAVWDKGSVQYALQNDADYLYVLFVFKKPKVLSSVDKTGMTLFFSPEGKKSKDYAVLFRKRLISGEQYLAILEKEGMLTEDVKSQIKPAARYNYYGSEVLAKKTKGATAPPGPAGEPLIAMFKSATADEDVVYEFRIPLRRATEAAAGVGAEPGAAFTLGFFWGGMTEEQKMAETKRQAEATNIANEGISSFTSRIVSSSGGPKPKEYDFWQAVQLAAIPKSGG